MFLLDMAVFLLVLGVLIFFHELGHFLAAKACGIYVDRFSLGMPPRLFGIRWGETDYCIGALPFGGYVKMAGQEDTPLSDEEREETYGKVPPDRWFSRKPVWQRAIVVFAGPAMNFVLAILLYGTVAFVGANVPETEVDTRIGHIEQGSPAANAPMYRATETADHVDLTQPPDTVGWQTGDRVITINGNRIRSIMDVAIDAVLGKGETLTVVIDRPERDGAYTRYVSPVKPAQLRETDRHARFGVAPFETVLVDDVLESSPAAKAGLQAGDIIKRANGEIIDRSTFIKATEETPEGEIMTLEVERGEQTFTQTVQPETTGRLQGVSAGPATRGADDTPPMIYAVTQEYSETGLLQPGDVIEQIEGQPATVEMLRDLEQTRPGETLSIQVRRPAVGLGLLREEQVFTAELEVAPVRAMGVQLGVRRVYARTPPAQVVPEAFRLAYQALERTIKTVSMLVRGNLSPKDLGGPVLIFQVTTTAAREGFWWLFSITAFISVNLCVFNLLPLPVLDGGLLMYLLVEGVRGKPLSPKVQERMQQVGLVLILTLFVLITWNDIARIVTRSLSGY